MKKIISVLLALSIIFSLTVPAFAAEEKELTYAERVANLKTNYNVVYRFNEDLSKTYDQKYINKLKNEALNGTELALSKIGASTFKVFTKQYSQFYISFEDLGKVTGLGNHTAGSVRITPYNWEYSSDEDESNITQDVFEGSLKYKIATVILHEIAHEYDTIYLNNTGTNLIKQIKIKNKMPETYTFSGQKKYLSVLNLQSNPIFGIVPRNSYDAAEDFAWIFPWIILQDGYITNWQYYDANGKSYTVTKNDIIYQACDAILNQMIKDFGTDSAAVKRASKFLEKELSQASQ